MSAASAVIPDVLFVRRRASHYSCSGKKNAGALVIVTSMVKKKNPGALSIHGMLFMLFQNIIADVDEPTEWVSNLVIVENKSGALRLC